jgi:hypothetical protein
MKEKERWLLPHCVTGIRGSHCCHATNNLGDRNWKKETGSKLNLEKTEETFCLKSLSQEVSGCKSLLWENKRGITEKQWAGSPFAGQGLLHL